MFLAILIGGLIGSAFGLPGALIGALIGGGLVYWGRMKLYRRVREVQSRFMESVFAVMGAVCKADGVVTQDEIQVAEALFERFHLNESQREAAKAAFNRGKADDFDLDAELDLWFSGLGKVRLEFRGSADIRQLGQMIATYVL